MLLFPRALLLGRALLIGTMQNLYTHKTSHALPLLAWYGCLREFNSLALDDTIWCQGIWPSLVQVMACYLTAPHITWTNVNLQSEVFCGIHLRTISYEMLMNFIHRMCYGGCTFKIIITSPRGQWVNVCTEFYLCHQAEGNTISISHLAKMKVNRTILT